MVIFLSLLLSFSLLYSQTVIIPIPGQKEPPQEKGTAPPQNSAGIVIGTIIGTGILLLLTKTVLSKPPPEVPKLPLIPFQFIVVYRGTLPKDIETKETVEIEDLRLSLIQWEEEPEELEEKLEEEVLIFQPNYVYETYGTGELKPSPSKASGPAVAVLDTGAHRELLEGVLLEVKNMRPDPYRPEDHGTAVSYLAHLPNKAGVILYRVCSEKKCDTWSITKALIDIIKRKIKVVNMSFGTSAKDKVVELLVKFAVKRGIKITAPVGNRPTKELPFPARLPEVISVAGSPCFPSRICERADVREPYRFDTPLGTVQGTSYSSAYHAGKITHPF